MKNFLLFLCEKALKGFFTAIVFAALIAIFGVFIGVVIISVAVLYLIKRVCTHFQLPVEEVHEHFREHWRMVHEAIDKTSNSIMEIDYESKVQKRREALMQKIAEHEAKQAAERIDKGGG